VSDTAGGAANTEVTPIPASAEGLWSLIGGARFGGDQLAAGSPTPFTVDFYSVAFRNALAGFAGGGQCKDSATTFSQLAGCDAPGKRVPVIYQFTEAAGHPGTGTWRKVDLPGGLAMSRRSPT